MKIHIVGAGPTGMSLAWEFLRAGDHDITIYDRKTSAGGSWWEPELEVRDIHAHRLVFDRAFINTRSLFKEMNIEWNDIFIPKNSSKHLTYVLKTLSLFDYTRLGVLYFRVLLQSEKYKSVSLKDAIGTLSESGKNTIEHLTLIMDGVDWETMSAYEFMKNLDHVALSKPYTQKFSGKPMCDMMEQVLIDNGVNFVFGNELTSIEYYDDGYSAKFANEDIINDGMLFLCIDNSPALKLLGDNWGPDAEKKVRYSTYGAINVLLDYESPMRLDSDLEIAATTEWKLQPVVLEDKKTISCVICKLTPEILGTDPDTLISTVLDQLKLPPPISARIGWGSTWNGEKWDFSQSSGVLSLHGPLPFFGKCTKVAMCGMMSPRQTPYSSMEASVEVSRMLSHKIFGTRKPSSPYLLSHVIVAVLIVLLLVFINEVCRKGS